MIFVVSNPPNPFVSSLLRGKHIADELGCDLLVKDIGGARNDVVVFVKDATREMVEKAKDRGNRIAYDPLDLYCYYWRSCPFAELVDVLIVPNSACAAFYRAQGFRNCEFAVIPHQWDHRIVGEAPQDAFRPGYVGNKFNCPSWWEGERATDMTDSVLPEFAKFNLHLSLNSRKRTHTLLKPAIKVASAAAVGANVVTYRDPSAVELLGPDYPFYVDECPKAAIRMACDAFGTPEWGRGLEVMKKVRKKTSLHAVANLYRQLAEENMPQAA